MTTEMKILQSDSADEIAKKINKHIAQGWKIAGNSFRTTAKSPGKIHYSILMMWYVPEENAVPPRPAPPTTTATGPGAEETNRLNREAYKRDVAEWERLYG